MSIKLKVYLQPELKIHFFFFLTFAWTESQGKLKELQL